MPSISSRKQPTAMATETAGKDADRSTDFILDPQAAPSAELATLYAQRWEIEPERDLIQTVAGRGYRFVTVSEYMQLVAKNARWNSLPNNTSYPAGTSILITSDHAYRPRLWNGRRNWTPAGPGSETVPFIVKLAGRNQAAVYDKPFFNIVAGELSLAVLTRPGDRGFDPGLKRSVFTPNGTTCS